MWTSGRNEANWFNNSWLADEMDGTPDEIIRSTLKYVDPASAGRQEQGPLTLGPNRACAAPIVPLTPDFSKVRSGIDAMKHWNGSGTNIAEGLAWGWRILSPEPPFTQAGRFDAAERRKFMVLMTDGTDVSFGARHEVTKSDYGSYNFLANGMTGGAVTQAAAEAKLNEWTADMCREMKRKGIEIFTVIYNETAVSVRNLFTACASSEEHFYMTVDTAALEKAFEDIGYRLNRLRLTR